MWDGHGHGHGIFIYWEKKQSGRRSRRQSMCMYVCMYVCVHEVEEEVEDNWYGIFEKVCLSWCMLLFSVFVCSCCCYSFVLV
jgi:hypothetical protein